MALFSAGVIALFLTAAAAETAARPRLDEAIEHYTQAKKLFEEGDKAQALIEFTLSFERSGNAEALFGMAQCEYHLGRLKDARAHYQRYLDSPTRLERSAEIARLRIATIERRPASVVITADPDEVDVKLEEQGGQRRVITGQGSNAFDVEHGRWKVTVAKKDYVSETREVAVDIAETRHLRFRLKPVPARLEIYTEPPGAALYVRGNRARNPYLQDVEAGTYEIYAEANEYQGQSDVVVVGPGQQKVVPFKLNYVQRSGKPELIGFWTGTAALFGAALVLERLSPAVEDQQPREVTGTAGMVTAGALVGGMGGAVLSAALVPNYIRDNIALFRIGSAWIGGVEGAMLGLTIRPSVGAGLVGGGVGLASGAVVGRWLDYKAPNYGRVAIIQSGAALGALAGAGLWSAIDPDSDRAKRRQPLAVFGGLNLGLGVGLALAYLPDQRTYGPTWPHVLLVDLAAVTGAITGALFNTVGRCVAARADGDPNSEDVKQKCSFQADKRTAQATLIGGGVGLTAGWLLTRNYDSNHSAPSERSAISVVPVPTVLPVEAPDGSVRALPGLAAQGRF